eukprot:TRINITY_DN3285_c0_g1_i1.p1 TRINITY_DN3285_c0_g1~~TRINITY_DN3285_c0_g1_i1.p1  ORF type:complete len:427 (-),score=59.35 TRINITY_DN3285_c0_g1_i1:788-2068(-)
MSSASSMSPTPPTSLATPMTASSSYDSLDSIPISPGLVFVAMFIFALTLPMAAHALRNYRKKRTLINLLQVLIGASSSAFQLLHFILATVASSQNMVSALGGIFQRWLWSFLILALSVDMAVNFWRFRMFDYVLPKLIFMVLKGKIIVPVIASFTIVLTWPLFAYVFVGTDVYNSNELSSVGYIWTKLGLAAFLISYVVADSVMCIAAFKFVLALRKGVSGSEVLSEAQMRFRRLSIATLLSILAIDIIFGVCMGLLTHYATFPYARLYSSLVFSVMMMHVSLSYLFTTLVVRFMAKNAKKLKFPKNKRSASKTTGDENSRDTRIPMPVSHTPTAADRGFRASDTPPSDIGMVQVTPPSSGAATYVAGGTGLSSSIPATPTLANAGDIGALAAPALSAGGGGGGGRSGAGGERCQWGGRTRRIGGA